MKISNTRFLKQPPILPTPPLLLEKSKPPFLDKFQKLEPLPFLKGWGGGGGGVRLWEHLKKEDRKEERIV